MPNVFKFQPFLRFYGVDIPPLGMGRRRVSTLLEILRIAFGEIASMAKGKKKTGFLPPAAEIVKEARGQIAGAVAGIPSQRDMRRTLHTVEDLRAIARQKGVEVVAARAAYALART